MADSFLRANQVEAVFMDEFTKAKPVFLSYIEETNYGHIARIPYSFLEEYMPVSCKQYAQVDFDRILEEKVSGFYLAELPYKAHEIQYKKSNHVYTFVYMKRKRGCFW